MPRDTKMTGDFSSKPQTARFAASVEAIVDELGETKKETRSQKTFGAKRKFLWLWTYGHTADGTLYLTVSLDHQMKNTHFHYVKQVSANRWNHHVVVKTKEQAEASWLKELVEAGYRSAN